MYRDSVHGKGVLADSTLYACQLSLGREVWLTHKLGPFETRGQGSGVKVEIFNLTSWYHEETPLRITGYQMRPVDATGEPPRVAEHKRAGRSRSPGGRTPRGRSPAAAAARRAWRSRRVAPRWLSCLRVPCSVWAFVAAAAARPAPCRALLWLGVAWLLSDP